MSIRGMSEIRRTALVISECQNGMTNGKYATNRELVEQVGSRRMLENIAGLASEFRAAGLPVFYVVIRPTVGFRGWAKNSLLSASIAKRPLTEGLASVEINAIVAPESDDFVVTRRQGLTCFHGTELDSL